MTEQEALLVLNAVPDLGAIRIRKLMVFFGSALEVLQASLDELSHSRLLTLNAAENIFHFSKDKFLQDEYNLMQRKRIVVLTSADDNFPGFLRNFEDSPVVLYVKGDIECLYQKSVAIVGSRAASFYGCRTAKSFAQAFVQAGLVVVSGLARGIDTAAHQGVLLVGGKTIAVIGCGFNYMYPKENHSLMESISKNGAVVSEFSFDMPPLKHNFPWRNRIISALSMGTVVIEAGKRSGALITAGFAMSQNKDVFVVPSNIDNETALEGSNQLIQEGALVVLNPDDVLSQIIDDYLPSSSNGGKPVLLLSDEQNQVYPHITYEPVHLDELAHQSGFNISSLSEDHFKFRVKTRDPAIARSILCKELINMSKILVIVESPAKVKTINKILGSKYKVTASMGHLIDLPKSTIGVDVDHDFEAKFIVVRDKMKTMAKLKKEAKDVDEIVIATDPDREGEAIGWNLIQHIAKDKKVSRVFFQEITKDAVKKAFANPREFNHKLVDAQNARRVLDRIVGYQISPLLWKKVGSRLSAGRVQSVALRLIVEREEAIRIFVPQEYWQIAVDLVGLTDTRSSSQKQGLKDILTANLEKIDGEKLDLKAEPLTNSVVAEIKKSSFKISAINTRQVKRNAPAPFITSTLQQEAFSKLGFNTSKTMMIAQQLYEGIEIGDQESEGLITYMRTDSVNIAAEAIEKVRGLIKKEHGKEYLPETPNKFKSKKSAQEAHEAIRPSDVYRHPEAIKQYLSDEQYRLYNLIWKRFISCQMMPAIFEQTKVEIVAARFQFGASGSILAFPGYLAMYMDNEEQDVKLDPSLYSEGDALNLLEVKSSQHFTKPPARYSEASLVKALEEQGIGRPSTYASIIHTLVYRNYVLRDRGYFTATELGIKICRLLMEYFKKVMDIGFTARMEEELDAIEDGTNVYAKVLRDFWGPFKEELDFAMANIQKTEVTIEKPCPDCGKPMVVKWGRRGRFISCTGFPDCKHAEAFTTGVKCPSPGCGGELVERRSHRGATFYGCSKYPDCKFIANKLPVPNNEPIPG